MRAIIHLAIYVIVGSLLSTGCVQERQDQPSGKPMPLYQPTQAMRWNVTRESQGKSQNSIELLLAKLDAKDVIYFVTKEDLDLVIFCDELPIKRCAKGLGGFFTTAEPDTDGDLMRFDPVTPYILNRAAQSAQIAVVGIKDGEVSVESRFAIIQEN